MTDTEVKQSAITSLRDMTSTLGLVDQIAAAAVEPGVFNPQQEELYKHAREAVFQAARVMCVLANQICEEIS